MEELQASGINSQLESLLSPDYWDGHMLGDLCPSSLTERTAKDISFRGCHRYAKQRLREHFAIGGNLAFPLETYEKGKVFDPNAYDPGAVVLFDEEYIYTQAQTDLAVFGPFFEQEGRDVPQRPADLPPNVMYSEHEGSKYIQENDPYVAYGRMVRWGVVTPTKQGTHVLTNMDSSMMGKSARNGKLLMLGGMVSYDKQITVGRAFHRNRYIGRTNVLRICGNGRTEKKHAPKWLPSMLGRLATGN